MHTKLRNFGKPRPPISKKKKKKKPTKKQEKTLWLHCKWIEGTQFHPSCTQLLSSVLWWHKEDKRLILTYNTITNQRIHKCLLHQRAFQRVGSWASLGYCSTGQLRQQCCHLHEDRYYTINNQESSICSGWQCGTWVYSEHWLQCTLHDCSAYHSSEQHKHQHQQMWPCRAQMAWCLVWCSPAIYKFQWPPLILQKHIHYRINYVHNKPSWVPMPLTSSLGGENIQCHVYYCTEMQGCCTPGFKCRWKVN